SGLTDSCEICGKSSLHVKFHAKDLLRESQHSFPILECRSCELLSTRLPTGFSDGRYPEDYYHRFKQHAVQESSTWLSEERLRRLERFKSRGTILDVGCGDGSFLTALEDAGWEAIGTEVNGVMAQSLRRQGLQVHEGELCALSLPHNSFDFITYFGSFEHVRHPREELREMKKILKWDGLVLFNVTNAGSPEAKFFGPSWFGLEIPRHFFNYTSEALSLLLRSEGFREVAVDIQSCDLITSYSLACRLGLQSEFFALETPLKWVSMFYSAMVSWFNRGNIVELICCQS
ncbi:MAG TPA: class I SAM-dependent methyltransferase, partial [Candidatus Bathyarchaeia archaeon]|nr:class I SAM-dependent methyltransferase [Candidatus Bathyarchaeia archaeon]